ncbi:nicotinamide riboside transporter PnuC [Tsuneonella sp. YG55]|uniref:Nicotinamide riboside transporter PnuC n=1 Tax=Tsuneonella litorea TaxID=2976475 RepID=A0A9X3AM36_9SPHN|nr:nicotinamide riboside transporter PnuC [Tsuneonella litorea]MCT2560028.1 nicotinamide riboside transporter PnuC [Tsuneonella litorea]
MSPLEVAGTVLGFVNIVLLIRRSVWNFPAAMAMVTCIGIVLFEARLYAEAGLQVFFFVVNAWGWWLWSHASGAGDTVPVRWLGWRARLAWGAATAAVSLSLGLTLSRWTDAALPMADSAIAGTSVAAQFLLSFRRIENWVLWIAIDVASIALYLARDLQLLAVLYAAFLILSVVGFREWARAARRAPA